jgi:hypothetical protein
MIYRADRHSDPAPNDRNVYKTLTAAGLNGGNLINGLPGSGRM